MLSIRTILHPTDFSENSRYAFRVACSLAERFTARLILLHVIPASVALRSQGLKSSPRVAAEDQDASKVQYAWPQPLNQKISVEHRVAAGESSGEILRIAQGSNCHLIVMGTHGRTGLQRVLMGSIAEAVLRKSVCPVLTVKTPHAFTASVTGDQSDRPDQEKRATLRIQCILMPTDFSPQSDYAFEVACSLAEEYAARLILLHVIPASAVPFPTKPSFNPLESADVDHERAIRLAATAEQECLCRASCGRGRCAR